MKMDTLNIDPDMRKMLDKLKESYVMDDDHIIRTLLRNRLRKIDNDRKL